MTIEIQLKTDDWDKDEDFNATWVFHLINLGWTVETEVLGK